MKHRLSPLAYPICLPALDRGPQKSGTHSSDQPLGKRCTFLPDPSRVLTACQAHCQVQSHQDEEDNSCPPQGKRPNSGPSTSKPFIATEHRLPARCWGQAGEETGVGRLGKGMVTARLADASSHPGAAFPACVPHLLQPAEPSRLRTPTPPSSTKPLKEINLSAD